MNITKIINTVNWEPQYDLKPILDDLFSKYPDLEYIGYGGTAITFKYDNMIVYKLCKKNNSNMRSGDEFIKYSNMLKTNDIKILLPIEIIYESNDYFVYSQPYCDILTKITTRTLIKILEIIKQMFIKKIRISDLYFRNFGIYKNDIIMFDFHDFTDFGSDDIYYITHLVHMFSLYKYNQLIRRIDITIDDIVKENFLNNFFPQSFVELLKECYYQNYDKAIIIIDNIIKDETKNLEKTYDNYQKIKIDEDGTINLFSHTKEKYDFFVYYKDYLKPNSLICDMGCSIGGIGSKIAQFIPDSNIDLINITINELDICQDIKETICLSNTHIINERVLNIKKVYDCGLYYAIIHHLLKDFTFDDIIQKIKMQNRNIIIIEFPLENDVLLKKIENEGNLTYSQTFYYLKNMEILINKLKENFKILGYKQIDYGTTELYRYVFALQIIS